MYPFLIDLIHSDGTNFQVFLSAFHVQFMQFINAWTGDHIMHSKLPEAMELECLHATKG